MGIRDEAGFPEKPESSQVFGIGAFIAEIGFLQFVTVLFPNLL